MRTVWFNGELVPERDAKVSIYDSAMMFGDTVFEMTRTFNGMHFKLPEHISRLFKSAKYLRIDIPYTEKELLEIVLYTCKNNSKEFSPDDEMRVMIDVTRGVLPMYREVMDTGVNVIVSVFPLKWTVAGMGKLFETGVNAVIPSQRAIPASLLETRVKSRSRIHFMMANIEASEMKGDNNWPILLDPSGYLTEGPGYNLFTVVGDNYLVPQSRNTLYGISRRYLLDQICPRWFERNLQVYDFQVCDEAFITATPFCMLPVTSVNGVPIGDGKPGPKYKEWLEFWSEDVGLDIKGQIQAWDTGAVEGPSAYKF